MICNQRPTRSLLTCLLWLICAVAPLSAAAASDRDATGSQDKELPPLHAPGTPYRTPRAGEGFRTTVFGRDIEIDPRDRRFVTGWDLDLVLYEPPPQNTALLPVGAISLWRHPDEERLLQAEICGIYNEIFWARKAQGSVPFEWVFNFENYTVPFAQAELVDGKSTDLEELTWGYVRPGFGLGFRRQVAPGHQDNMAAVDFTVEPEYVYFRAGASTSPNFIVPRDTFILRGHVQVRLDALERNILELPHRGIAAGADLIAARRESWEAWGMNGREGDAGRNYQSYTGYVLAAGGVPGIESDRHRLVGEVHAGTGRNLDRFSATRVGGGQNPMGEDFFSTVYPILPGAVIGEFFPQHFVIATAEYRWEPVFFAYLAVNGSVARLDRLRFSGTDVVERTDNFTAVGARVTSGFLYRTRVRLAYTYNFSVVREGEYGGNEILLSVSKDF